MLDLMRNHARSWLSKVLLGGIVLSFALWGVGDYFRDSPIKPVAVVDDVVIPETAFYQAYQMQVANYRSILGASFSKEMAERLGLKEQTLRSLVNRQLVLLEAEKAGIVIPQAMLVASLKSTPAFRGAKGFDAERYRILTRNMGYANPADFEKEQLRNMMASTLEGSIKESVMLRDEDVRARYEHDYQQRVLSVLMVRPTDLLPTIVLSDAEAKAWYESHQNRYLSPLRLHVQIAEIDPKKLMADMQPSEERLKALYEEQLPRLISPEKRLARHILLKIKGDKAAVRKRLLAIKARLAKGEDFAALAKQYSEDKGTAEKGGSLGWFGRGAMVPAFEKAAFALQKGAISDVIETPFGLHLLKLDDVQVEKTPTYAEARQDLLKQEALKMAEEEAYQLSQDLDDALGREDSLQAAADAVNLPVRDLQAISLADAASDSVFADQAFRQKVFSLNEDSAIALEELDDGRFVAVSIVKRMDPAPMPFAKLKARVVSDAKAEKADAQAKAMAEDLLAKKGTDDLTALAQKSSKALYVSKPVRYNGEGDTAAWLSQSVLQAAFAEDIGRVHEKVLSVPNAYVLLSVRSLQKAKPEDFAKHEKEIRDQLIASLGQQRFARWLASVRARHEVEVHPEVITRL